VTAPKIDWTGQKKVNLALQGGGAHGAFTWGVLDAILEDGRLDIEAITGTSAGAMNAVVFAQGYLEGGREGARKALEKFWQTISNQGSMGSNNSSFMETLFKPFGGFDSSPAYWWLDFVTHYTSPYDFNPLDINPLRDVLEQAVDFEKVRACRELKLFISATNVHTGKIAVFHREELTAAHVLASACLPFIFQAVEIKGESYWDGGYSGNPPLFPVFYESKSPDVIIVQINPIERHETPKTARDIQNRVNEITFNGTLLHELRAVEFVQRLVDNGQLPRDKYMRPFLHRIDGEEPLKQFSASSKLDASWAALTAIRDIGRTAGKAWLASHYDDIGKKDTMDLRAAFS
jgi:NTE family protein